MRELLTDDVIDFEKEGYQLFGSEEDLGLVASKIEYLNAILSDITVESTPLSSKMRR